MVNDEDAGQLYCIRIRCFILWLKYETNCDFVLVIPFKGYNRYMSCNNRR